ncbi:TrbC/VirB2 family protein [Patescibacteria group bacterium]|nr:TrbC/VirB2 family protein [Patescibacteria group bacterium]
MQKLIHIKIKPFLLKFFGFFILEMGLARLAFAQKLKNPLKYDDFGKIIEGLAQAIATIGIPIAAIFIIYSGLLFVTARGNEEQLTKAKKTLGWTLIGTLLVVGAWVIAEALSSLLDKL